MKFLVAIIILLVGSNSMGSDSEFVLEKLKSDGFIEWVHKTENQDILGVGASQKEGDQYWHVFVSFAEFVREEPLESKFRSNIHKALKRVEGVKFVEEEDREVWVVKGSVNGDDLVRSCVKELEKMYPELEKYLNEI